MSHEYLNHEYETTIMHGDFDDAQPRDCKRCLVANAIRRVTGHPCIVGHLDSGNSVAAFGAAVYRITEGAGAISNFDQGMEREKLLGRRIRIVYMS